MTTTWKGTWPATGERFELELVRDPDTDEGPGRWRWLSHEPTAGGGSELVDCEVSGATKDEAMHAGRVAWALAEIDEVNR